MSTGKHLLLSQRAAELANGLDRALAAVEDEPIRAEDRLRLVPTPVSPHPVAEKNMLSVALQDSKAGEDDYQTRALGEILSERIDSDKLVAIGAQPPTDSDGRHFRVDLAGEVEDSSLPKLHFGLPVRYEVVGELRL